MKAESAIDWDEMFEYLPGTVVELKNEPGVLYPIDRYEATMVPPIWLVKHPRSGGDKVGETYAEPTFQPETSWKDFNTFRQALTKL